MRAHRHKSFEHIAAGERGGAVGFGAIMLERHKR